MKLVQFDGAKRIKMIKAMEFLCRQINDEDVFDGWLKRGVADGDISYGDLDAQDRDGVLSYYCEDDNYADLMQQFLSRMAKAYKSGGLYSNGIVSNGKIDGMTAHVDIMKELERQSKYAIASKSRHLVFEVYGLLKGLRMAGAISKDEFFKYNTILVRDTMNNGPVWNSFRY